MTDSSALDKMKWGAIIVDEGHRLKNFQSRLSRTLSNLHSPFRCLLTAGSLRRPSITATFEKHLSSHVQKSLSIKVCFFALVSLTGHRL